MPADKKDDPTQQDGQQQPKPTKVIAAEKNRPDNGADKYTANSHGFWFRSFRSVEVALVLAGIAGAVLAVKTWQESAIDKAVEKKLSEPIILRKIAAESRPTVIINGKGSILHDMGAVQYLKPDDIRISEYGNDQGIIFPAKLHVGFVRPVSFAPLVTSLFSTANITANHGKGLDWEFTINWMVLPLNTTNEEDLVFRVEVVP
jgi:hypothetical protein